MPAKKKFLVNISILKRKENITKSLLPPLLYILPSKKENVSFFTLNFIDSLEIVPQLRN